MPGENGQCEDSVENYYDEDVDSITSEFQNLRSPSVSSLSSCQSRYRLSEESGNGPFGTRRVVFNEYEYEREKRLREKYLVYENKKNTTTIEKKEKTVKIEWSSSNESYKKIYSSKKSKITTTYNTNPNNGISSPLPSSLSPISHQLQNGREIELSSRGIQHATPPQQTTENNPTIRPLVNAGQLQGAIGNNNHETTSIIRQIKGNNSNQSNSSDISESNIKILAPNKRKPFDDQSSPSSQKRAKIDPNITSVSPKNTNRSGTNETASSNHSSPTHSSYQNSNDSSENHDYSSECSCSECSFSFITIELDKDAILKLLESSMKEMKKSEFLIAAAETLHTVIQKTGKQGLGKSIKDLQHIVVYGLGSLSCREEVEPGLEDRHDSLHQFTFITCLLQKLGIPNTNIDFFDPKFTDIDKEIITKDFGFNIVDRNELGKREVDDDLTLFYLPHVTFSLTNGVLSANWSPDSLSNVIILGNSFQSTLRSVQNHFPRPLYSYIKKANQVSKEVELNIPKENDDYPTAMDSWAFYGQSIHVFPPSLVQSKTDDAKFWAIDSTFQAMPKPKDGNCDYMF